ncbi:MAG: hypothetical protein Q8O88_04240 [bacterium]|nr:hypothetical protein [bacterium]
MKNPILKLAQFAGMFVTIFLLSSCNSIQPVLILTPGDFIILGIIDIFLSLALALYITGAKSKWKFWLWFIIGVFLPIILIVVAIVHYAFSEDKKDE